jgi:hypothetical protein
MLAGMAGCVHHRSESSQQVERTARNSTVVTDCQFAAILPTGPAYEVRGSYRQILVTEGVRRQLELAI